MAYEHGIRIQEQATSLAAPITGTAGLQVVFGTAPVNLADDPYGVTNIPVIAHNWAEAVAQLGYSEDYAHYTLCQSMYASFKLAGVAPVIFINVLDPRTHKKANDPVNVHITDMVGVVPITGILKDTVVVKVGEEALTADADYVLTFDGNGNLVVTLLAAGAGASASDIIVESTSIDPAAVTANDIIGVSTNGTEKGFEVLRQVYPKFGMTPGLIIAPGWSHIPDVGIVLAAKCEEINGYFSCEGYVDIDSTADGCTTYTDVKSAKEAAGCSSAHVMPLWPCIAVGSRRFWYSAIMAAFTAYLDATNDDVPCLSPSNKLIGVTGTVLADGVTEVVLDQVQGNAVNGCGVTTAINVNGWRTWGNRSAIYPASSDPKDSFFCFRRFFSWWGNSFILTYFEKVDDPANIRLIESIVDSENARGAAYVAEGKCARAEIEFSKDENPTTDLIAGKLRFRQHLTPYPPAEDILNVLEFDPEALATALGG